MIKLTSKEKKEILDNIKKAGWAGCMCDECLLLIAETVLDYQLKKNEK